MENFVDLVSGLGFPIACCLVLAYYIKYKDNQFKDEKKEMLEQHYNEIAKFVVAIENNSSLIKELSATIKGKK